MKKILFSLMAVLLGAGMVGSSLAYFTDVETITGNIFTAGTLDITLGTANYSANILNMKPGDTKTVNLNVYSLGTLPLNYTISGLLTGAIISGPNDPYISQYRVDGVVTASDSLSAAGGDDSSDVVEVDITLPLAAGNEYQKLNGNLAITFDAIQQ